MKTALMAVGTGCEVQRHAPYDDCRALERRRRADIRYTTRRRYTGHGEPM